MLERTGCVARRLVLLVALAGLGALMMTSAEAASGLTYEVEVDAGGASRGLGANWWTGMPSSTALATEASVAASSDLALDAEVADGAASAAAVDEAAVAVRGVGARACLRWQPCRTDLTACSD